MMLSIVIEHFISLPSTQITPYNHQDVEADGQVALQRDLQSSPQTSLPSSSSFSLLPIFFRSCQDLVKKYDTITRAAAGYPTRMAHIMNRKAQEAREKGGWIDVHDYVPCAPGKYDTIVSNVNDGVLRTEVSEILGIPYLGQAAEDDTKKAVKCIDGQLYSPRCHPIVPCVVRTYSGEARWVFFVVDTTAPVTYLSPQVGPIYPV